MTLTKEEIRNKRKQLGSLAAKRDELYTLLQSREALGGFDVHANVILEVMRAQVQALNFLIDLANISLPK